MNIRKIFWMVVVLAILMVGFLSTALAEKIMVVPCGVAMMIKTRETENGSIYGLGTMTFYQPDDNYFVALGHELRNKTNDELIDVSGHIAYLSDISDVVKNEVINSGYIEGKKTKEKIGTIKYNTPYGVYGEYNRANKTAYKREAIPVAEANEIEFGEATIICTLEGKLPKEYQIEISGIRKAIYRGNYFNFLVIKFTDKELLKKTNGIIQGLSGSPIIQDGKFVGAMYGQIFDQELNEGVAIMGINMVIR